MKGETLISTGASLKDLVQEIGLFKSARKNIRIQFHHLSEQENMNLQHQVVKYYKTCGCSQGRITGIITLLAFASLVITGIVSMPELGLAKTVLYYFICSFITMLIAKIIGIWQARLKLSKLAEVVENIPIEAH